MPRETYIDKHDLGGRVSDLSFRQGKTDTAIAAILTSEGYKVSQPTVSRWLQEKRQENANQVKAVMQDHLEKHLPKDLSVIEQMEELTFAWSLEEPKALVEKLINQGWCLDACERWENMIKAASGEKDKFIAMKEILKEAMGRVVEFFNERRERLNSVKATRELVGLKLQYAGIIEGAQQGNIYIMTSKKDGSMDPAPAMGGKPNERPGLRMVVKRGDMNA